MTTTSEPIEAGTRARDELAALAQRLIAEGEGPPAPGPDLVNLPMIRHWTQAMGDANPLYTDAEFAASTVHGGIVAPPAMVQVWTMGSADGPRERTPITELLSALDARGYTGVVATNCEQTYHRHLRLGERVLARSRLSGLAGPKTTALGEGYFVTWIITWYAEPGDADQADQADQADRGDHADRNGRTDQVDQNGRVDQTGKPDQISRTDQADQEDASGGPVAEMLFRVLKFRPRERKPEPAGRQPYPLKPAINRDTAFFWEGVREGELRIQKCADCGELRHPPGPVCPSCRSLNRTYALASGVGEVYSHVVHHHPPVPGLEPPFAVAVVQLPEGVRIVGNVVDCPPADVHVGMPVRVVFRQMDDELILPQWTPRES